ARGRLLRERNEAEAIQAAAERAPALAHELEELRRLFRNGSVDLVEVLGVMTVRVRGHDADDPAVVSVDPLGRQLLELGDQPLEVACSSAGNPIAPMASRKAIEFVWTSPKRSSFVRIAASISATWSG